MPRSLLRDSREDGIQIVRIEICRIKKVVVKPAHGDLKHLVQVAQQNIPANLQGPPDWRIRMAQSDIQEISRFSSYKVRDLAWVGGDFVHTLP
jgi:hypothetical protein